MFCPKCGSQMSEGAIFCPKCGQRVGNGTDSAPVTNSDSITSDAAKTVEKLATVSPSTTGKSKEKKGFSKGLKILLISAVAVAICAVLIGIAAANSGGAVALPDESAASQAAPVVEEAAPESDVTAVDSTEANPASDVATTENTSSQAVKPQNGKGTTILIYMVGSNLESDRATETDPGAATEDMDEILKSDFKDDVHVIVETGGSKQWGLSRVDFSYVDPNFIQRYQLRNGKKELVEKLDKANMADPNTLSDFLKWGVENYPAERFIAILWDHGGGTIGNFGMDELYNDSGMDLSEIQMAFNKAGYKFDVIGFDACLMGTIETAFALHEYGDYLIASEETEVGCGWYYTDWINSLGKNPNMDTLEICKGIADSYIDKTGEMKYENQTMSVMNLSHSEDALSTLSSFLDKANEKIVHEEGFTTIATARINVRTYGKQLVKDEYKDVSAQIDIIDFLVKSGLANEKEAISAFIGEDRLVAYENNSYINSHGVAMYLPFEFQVNPQYDYYGHYNHAADLLKKIGYEDSYFLFFDNFLGRIAEIDGYDFEPQCNLDNVEEEIQETVEANPYPKPILTEDGWLPVKKDEEGKYYIDMTEMPDEWRQNLISISYINCKWVKDDWYITSYDTQDPLTSNAFFGQLLEGWHEASGTDSMDQYLFEEWGAHSEEEFLNRKVEDLKSDKIYIDPFAERQATWCDNPVLLLDTGMRTDSFGYYVIPAAVNGIDSNVYVELSADREDWRTMGFYTVIGYSPINNGESGSELRNLLEFKDGDEICPEFISFVTYDRIKSSKSFKYDVLKGLHVWPCGDDDPFRSYDSLGVVRLLDAFGFWYESYPIAIAEVEKQ